MDLLFDVNETSLKLNSPAIVVSTQVNYDVCNFTFGPEWDGFTKTAVFYSAVDETRMSVLVGDDNKCFIPWESILDPGSLYVGIFGAKGTTEVPTNFVMFKSIQGSAGSNVPPPPSIDIYLQILDRVASMRDYTTTEVDDLTARQNIVEAKQTDVENRQDIIDLGEAGRVTAEALRELLKATMIEATDYANNSHGKDGFSSIVESQFIATVANTTHITTHFNDYNPLSDELQVNGGKYNSDLTKGLQYTENADNKSIDLIGWNIGIGDIFNFKLYKHIDEGNIATNIADLITATASGVVTKSALDTSIANGQIGNVTQLTTQDKTNLVNAINENVTKLASKTNQSDLVITNGQIGKTTDLKTQDKTNLVNAINENVTNTDDNTSSILLKSNIIDLGNKANLPTVDKTSFENSIKELYLLLLTKLSQGQINQLIGFADINKNLSQIDSTMCSTSLLAMIAGTAGVNVTPAQLSVLTGMFADYAVIPEKTDFMQTIFKNLFNQVYVHANLSGSTTLTFTLGTTGRTAVINISPNTLYTIIFDTKPERLKVATNSIYKIDANFAVDLDVINSSNAPTIYQFTSSATANALYVDVSTLSVEPHMIIAKGNYSQGQVDKYAVKSLSLVVDNTNLRSDCYPFSRAYVGNILKHAAYPIVTDFALFNSAVASIAEDDDFKTYGISKVIKLVVPQASIDTYGTFYNANLLNTSQIKIPTDSFNVGDTVNFRVFVKALNGDAPVIRAFFTNGDANPFVNYDTSIVGTGLNYIDVPLVIPAGAVNLYFGIRQGGTRTSSTTYLVGGYQIVKNAKPRVLYAEDSTPSVTISDPNILYVNGLSNEVDIFKPSIRNYLKFPWVHVLTPYTDGGLLQNADLWHFIGCYEMAKTDSGFTDVNSYSFLNSGEIECAIKLSGAADFVGGLHGYEVLTDTWMTIDGIQVALGTVFSMSCKEIVLYQKSNIYQNGTQTIIAEHLKYHVITKDGIKMHQTIKWLKVEVVNVAYMSMLTTRRTSDDTATGVKLTDHFYEDVDYAITDVSDDTANVSTPTAAGVKLAHLWGASSGLSSQIEIIGSQNVNNAFYVWSAPAYNKFYFKYCEDSHTTVVNEIWQNDAIYKIDIK